jgi:hypothetical protein
MYIYTFYIRKQVYKKTKKLCGSCKKRQVLMLYHDYVQDIVLSFLYTQHKMLFHHEKVCTNIECHDVHTKNYVRNF